MAIWGTSVSLPAGATVGGKTEAQIGVEIQAALNAGDKGKLESILGDLKGAGHSGSYNASQPFLNVIGRSESTGIVPDSAATSPAATIRYAAENQMLTTGETKAVLQGGARSQGEATQMAPLYEGAAEQTVQFPSPTPIGGARTSPIGGTQRGFLNQPTGRYPVAPMGYPSGVSYPAAQDAAQGWAGEMGFNINPRGGLLLRPWEAASWDLSGIDPALWDAPFARGGFLGGGGYPGGVPGGVPGGYPGTIPGPINTGGTTGTTTTDTSGNQWVMSPGGQWYPADSDYGQGLLGNSRLFYDQHYDSSGAYVGAEGTSYDDQGFEIDRQGRRTGGYINDSLGIGNKILGWMGADPAEVQRTRAIMADADMDVAASVGAATQGKYGTGGYQGTGVNAQPSGLLATNPYANNPYGSFPTGQNPSAHGARWEEIDPYGIDAGGTSGYDVAAGYRAYDNAMNAAARRTAAAGGVPWGSDYANRMGALSSSNQAALDAAAFHASLTGMPNLANIATAPTIVSANPA